MSQRSLIPSVFKILALRKLLDHRSPVALALSFARNSRVNANEGEASTLRRVSVEPGAMKGNPFLRIAIRLWKFVIAGSMDLDRPELSRPSVVRCARAPENQNIGFTDALSLDTAFHVGNEETSPQAPRSSQLIRQAAKQIVSSDFPWEETHGSASNRAFVLQTGLSRIRAPHEHSTVALNRPNFAESRSFEVRRCAPTRDRDSSSRNAGSTHPPIDCIEIERAIGSYLSAPRCQARSCK